MTPFTAVILTVLSFVQLGWAQIGYNANTNSLLCSKPGGHYCVHGSLQGPTMISCVSTTTAEIRSCNIELVKILPPGYKDMAICYETAPILGDALCAFNGTGYPRSGKPIPIPETALCTAGSSNGDPDNYGDSDDNGAIDSNSDSSLSPKYRPPKRSHSFPLELESPKPQITTTTRADNEKGIIQTMPSLPLPPPITPLDPLTVLSTLTMQPRSTGKSLSRSQPPCVPQLRVRDPNTTVPAVSGSGSINRVSSGPAFAALTSTPTSPPTVWRPRLADKCTWTPTPMYRTGAGVVRSSSSSSSISSSSEVASSSSIWSSSVKPTETSGGKKSRAAACLAQRIGVGMLVVWVLGWGVVLGWV
ncbi:uncharacterized protein KD926_000160 [Aspergillus affinis]|uniref:uncharacterized protein n=1 Tax=Aspergillus affinis TaxID=1070780 RepID=UPI0022FF1DC0|nr:uncharacterized protein KD926_000160 [Aspergillus affinis]KAI9037598.1 hypothetical protein KD926_000160 [Aspergillus affinis]